MWLIMYSNNANMHFWYLDFCFQVIGYCVVLNSRIWFEWSCFGQICTWKIRKNSKKVHFGFSNTNLSGCLFYHNNSPHIPPLHIVQLSLISETGYMTEYLGPAGYHWILWYFFTGYHWILYQLDTTGYWILK